MKVSALIALLQQANPDAIVEIYDPDAEHYAPITGMVHNAAEVQLHAECEDENVDD